MNYLEYIPYILAFSGTIISSIIAFLFGRKKQIIDITRQTQEIYQGIIDDLREEIENIKKKSLDDEVKFRGIIKELHEEFERKLSTISQTIISKDRIIQEQIIKIEMQSKNLKVWEDTTDHLNMIINEKIKIINILEKEIDECQSNK